MYLAITCMLMATYAESVSSIPFLDIGPPTGPILNGTTYIVRPEHQESINLTIDLKHLNKHVFAFHRARKKSVNLLVQLFGWHPVSQLTSDTLRSVRDSFNPCQGWYDGARFYAGHVSGVSPCQEAVVIFGQWNQYSTLHKLTFQLQKINKNPIKKNIRNQNLFKMLLLKKQLNVSYVNPLLFRDKSNEFKPEIGDCSFPHVIKWLKKYISSVRINNWLLIISCWLTYLIQRKL